MNLTGLPNASQGEINIAAAGAGGAVALPEGFPTDVYLPSERVIESAMDMAGMQMVNLVTPDDLQLLYAEIEKTMGTGDWKRDMAIQEDDGATLVYSKDKRQVIYRMNRNEAGTELTLRAGSNG